MHDAVELLLSRAEDIETKAKEYDSHHRKKLDEQLKNARKEAHNLRLAAQEICPHDKGVREEEDEDYHKHETWTEEFCLICNKKLRRH